MEIIKENFIIETLNESSILGDLFYKENSKTNDLVIFCHGYKGFKDWGPWNKVAAKFANENFTFCKFNFSLNGGTLQQPIDFPDLDAFGRNTYTQEINDLGRVVDYLTYDFYLSLTVDE